MSRKKPKKKTPARPVSYPMFLAPGENSEEDPAPKYLPDGFTTSPRFLTASPK